MKFQVAFLLVFRLSVNRTQADVLTDLGYISRLSLLKRNSDCISINILSLPVNRTKADLVLTDLCYISHLSLLG